MNLFLLRETIGMASRALAANRLRSVLALLGIVIGVATVIGMVALINGFQRSFQQSIQAFGNNTIYIRRVEKVGGNLVNVEFDKVENVKDPVKAAMKK